MNQSGGSQVRERTKGMNLHDKDHVARHVPWKKLRKDEDGNVIGLLPTAFQLRPQESSLSVSWLEYFSGDRENQLREMASTIRRTRDIGPKSVFGIGNVGTLRSSCQGYGTPVRVVFAPTKENSSHCQVRHLPQDDLALLALVAEDVFTEIVRAADISD
jgi:hypothetical protein